MIIFNILIFIFSLLVSEAPEEEQKAKKFVSYEEYRQTYKSDEQKKEEVSGAYQHQTLCIVIYINSY